LDGKYSMRRAKITKYNGTSTFVLLDGESEVVALSNERRIGVIKGSASSSSSSTSTAS